MSIIKLIDELWKNQSTEILFSLQHYKKGKHFFLKLKEDLDRIRDIQYRFALPTDKKDFISGDTLFPITIRIWNWEEEFPGKPIKLNLSKNLDTYRLHYFGISPDLENFVTLILWPENSKHSFKVLEEVYHSIEAQKQPLIYLEGDYRIKLPNEIHPYRFSNIQSTLSDRIFEWRYIPWLKDSGDTIFKHISPINYRKVYLNTHSIEYAYINARIGIGVVKDVMKHTSELKLKLPYLSKKSKWKYLITKVLKVEDLKSLRKGDIIYFTLFEVVHNDGKFIPEKYVYRIEKADFVDIIGHLAAFMLYQIYLESTGLWIMSLSEFEKIYSQIIIPTASQFCNSCDKTKLIDRDLLFKSYLEPFFTIYEGSIYYVPTLVQQYGELGNFRMDTKSNLDFIYKTDRLFSIYNLYRSQKLDISTVLEVTGIETIVQFKELRNVIEKVKLVKELNRMIKLCMEGWKYGREDSINYRMWKQKRE